jgi:hypothetical protein
LEYADDWQANAAACRGKQYATATPTTSPELEYREGGQNEVDALDGNVTGVSNW